MTFEYAKYQLQNILETLPRDPAVYSLPIVGSLFYRLNFLPETYYLTKQELEDKETFKEQYNNTDKKFKPQITTTLFCLKIISELSPVVSLRLRDNKEINSVNLSTVIFKFSLLEYLNLSSTSVKDDIILLSESLSKLNRLTTLDISNNKLPEDSTLLALENLPKNLEALNLNNNVFPTKSMEILIKVLEIPKLKTLFMSGTGLSANDIVTSLEKNTEQLQLEKLDVSHNNLGDIPSGNILKLFCKLPLKFLDISYTKMFQKPINPFVGIVNKVTGFWNKKLIKTLDELINLSTLEKLVMSSGNLNPNETEKITNHVNVQNIKYNNGLNKLINDSLEKIMPQTIVDIIGDYFEPNKLILELDYFIIE